MMEYLGQSWQSRPGRKQHTSHEAYVLAEGREAERLRRASASRSGRLVCPKSDNALTRRSSAGETCAPVETWTTLALCFADFMPSSRRLSDTQGLLKVYAGVTCLAGLLFSSAQVPRTTLRERPLKGRLCSLRCYRPARGVWLLAQ